MVTVHETREFDEWTVGQAALRSDAAQGVAP